MLLPIAVILLIKLLLQHRMVDIYMLIMEMLMVDALRLIMLMKTDKQIISVNLFISEKGQIEIMDIMKHTLSLGELLRIRMGTFYVAVLKKRFHMIMRQQIKSIADIVKREIFLYKCLKRIFIIMKVQINMC